MAEHPPKPVHVLQGQFHVSGDPAAELITVLGSCVAACLHDPVRALGGMNHFLLPGHDPNDGQCVTYGAHSMDRLINAMMRQGTERDRLEVRLFGGANVVPGLGRIGDANAAFACDYVRREGLLLRSVDTGGRCGRRLHFHPVTGMARAERLDLALDPAMKLVNSAERASPGLLPPTGTVDLF